MKNLHSNFLVTNSKTLSIEELLFIENIYPINAGQHTHDFSLVTKSLHLRIRKILTFKLETFRTP